MSEQDDGASSTSSVSADSAPGSVRIRGIYTTAITQLLLEAGYPVVDASPPISRRFDTSFPAGPAAVSVETSDDRLGVGIAGDATTVRTLQDRFANVGRDAITWTDPTPPGAVFDGAVTDTLGGGAVVSLAVGTETRAGTIGPAPGPTQDGRAEGYLPYSAVDERIDEGDRVRVQVRTSAAPWERQRPELDATLRASGGGLVSLEPGSGTRVDARNDEGARELAGMTDLLGLEAPAGWQTVWHGSAVDADMDALKDALSAALDAVDRLSDAEHLNPADRTDDTEGITDDDVLGIIDPATTRDDPLAMPTAGAWVRFGRECRFALDEIRAAVTPTMPGHHRIKAGSADASAGVDLAEALSTPDPSAEFPFTTVRSVFGPAEGDALRIEHGKPDGRHIVLGEGTVTEVNGTGLTLEREMTAGGSYDALGVRREAGDMAITAFKEGRWWYPTTYRTTDGTVKGTYVNVCTPVELFPDAASYVDLHVDVVKHADGTVKRVDDDILDDSVAAGHTPEPLAEKARSVATALEKAL